MDDLQEAIAYLAELKAADPHVDKARLQAAFVAKFGPQRARSVFVGNGYALRFCEAQRGGFSNTVLSLSALREHDRRPVVLAVNRPDRIDFLLANSTLLRKVSHSSHDLRVNNVRGSFNGTDVLLAYEGLSNRPEHFTALFAMHEAFSWDENVERLVEATNGIVARDNFFNPQEQQIRILLEAGQRAHDALNNPAFVAVAEELRALLQSRSEHVLAAAEGENVNLRGNAIERLIVGGDNAHELADIERDIGGRLGIDIKTKLLNRGSAPKGYNIDKALTFLAQPLSVLAFFFIFIDPERRRVTGCLVPVLERSILEATRIQHHWAGRHSRGVTQLQGDLSFLEAQGYKQTVDVERAAAFIQRLIDLRPRGAATD